MVVIVHDGYGIRVSQHLLGSFFSKTTYPTLYADVFEKEPDFPGIPNVYNYLVVID